MQQAWFEDGDGGAPSWGGPPGRPWAELGRQELHYSFKTTSQTESHHQAFILAWPELCSDQREVPAPHCEVSSSQKVQLGRISR